jgi:hypothetical protein
MLWGNVIHPLDSSFITASALMERLSRWLGTQNQAILFISIGELPTRRSAWYMFIFSEPSLFLISPIAQVSPLPFSPLSIIFILCIARIFIPSVLLVGSLAPIARPERRDDCQSTSNSSGPIGPDSSQIAQVITWGHNMMITYFPLMGIWP